jgi:hypothetical protein
MFTNPCCIRSSGNLYYLGLNSLPLLNLRTPVQALQAKSVFGAFISKQELMCFSASASFGAGIVLSVVGVASIKKVKQPSQIPFATIPLLFAMQQITEGFLWLSLTSPDFASLKEVSMYNFLFFAQVAWPIWAPFAVMMFEPKERRRKFEKVLVGVGAVVSIYLAYCLVVYHVDARIDGAHISYEQDYPRSLGLYGSVFYFAATVAPPFFSRIRGMWMLGAAIFISYLITYLLYTDYIISVWCFFASVISIAIYVIVAKKV